MEESEVATIVLIDDDLDLLETVGALLEHEGFTVRSADTVEDGIDLIASVRPDVVLLDLVFPELGPQGYTTAGAIKDRFPNLPLFVLTSINRDYALSVSRADIRADEFVTKPVRLERLVELIRRYLP